MKINYIDEPGIMFGHGQITDDPRKGLFMFGPYSNNSVSGLVSIGVIGPKYLTNKFKSFIEWLHSMTPSAGKNFPMFPGLESVYDLSINSGNVVSLEIPIEDINEALKYTESHIRIYYLTENYAKHLKRFQLEEHHNVNLWFVLIPESVYKSGFPKSTTAVPSNEKNRIKLHKSELGYSNQFLFQEYNEYNLAYSYKNHFHDQLKVKLLENQIITQLLREETMNRILSTVVGDNYRSDQILRSMTSWNLSNSIYYKVGGYPWVLSSLRKDVCYIGLIYKNLENETDLRTACCGAQVFLDNGDGIVFRGNLGSWYNPERREYHLSEQEAYNLLKSTIDGYILKMNSDKYPKEVFLHSRTYFNDEEWAGFQSAVGSETKLIGIRIRRGSNFKMFRPNRYGVLRGTCLTVDTKQAYLFTTGFIPSLGTQPSHETPNPLDISIVRGDGDPLEICKDILALTKLNYNTCNYGDGIPVTLRFADRIGAILSSQHEAQKQILTFRNYI